MGGLQYGGLSDLAKDAGLHPLVCPHCGRKFSAFSAVELLFKELVRRLAAHGEVKIRLLGTFRVKVHKARGITKAAGDRKYVTFETTPRVKRLINGEEPR